MHPPRGPVLHVQALAFITRAMVDRGYRTLATGDDPGVCPDVPASSGHRLELVTFVRNAGAAPGLPLGGSFTAFDGPATRTSFSREPYQAHAANFSVNRIP